jgi:hypothetical protein
VLQLTPDERVALVGEGGLLGAFAFDGEPVGAVFAELLGDEVQDRLAEEQQHGQQ